MTFVDWAFSVVEIHVKTCSVTGNDDEIKKTAIEANSSFHSVITHDRPYTILHNALNNTLIYFEIFLAFEQTLNSE